PSIHRHTYYSCSTHYNHPTPHSFPTRRSSDLNVPVKTKIRGYVAGREKRVGVEPLAWLTKDNGSGEVWVEKRTHRIARIAVPGRDRKSTRLNSSHRTISYAVFCLKKKNRNNPT